MMSKIWIGLAAVCATAPAMAQDLPGAVIADFYMNEFSIPKGWTLSYKGKEGKTEVFVMDRDLDTHPQTLFLRPIEQVRRLMCGDEDLKAMVTGGTIIRVDARDKQDGATRITKGPELTSC